MSSDTIAGISYMTERETMQHIKAIKILQVLTVHDVPSFAALG